VKLRKAPSGDGWPEPPEYLRTCVIEDRAHPSTLAEPLTSAVLASAWVRYGEARHRWLKEQGVPWEQHAAVLPRPRPVWRRHLP